MDEDINNQKTIEDDGTSFAERLLASSYNKIRHPMEALLRGGTGFAVPPKIGEIVDGVILEKRGTQVFVDLGPQGVGIVFGREYYAAQDVIKNLKSGDTISAKVVEVDNEDGFIELSLKEAGEEKRWVEIKEFLQKGQSMELPVVEANKGGLLLEYKGLRGFLPASQLSSKHYPRVEGGDKERIFQELKKLIGETLGVKVIDVNSKENKVIFSEKDSESGELRLLLAKFKVGDVVEGEVTGVVDFGAFVKFNDGLEGLIHISEIDWGLVENPRDVLKAGDKVTAKVIDIQGDKVSLSLKQLKEDPWKKIAEKYHKGDIVTGRVTKHNPFGAFVELDVQIQGLVHISEFGTEAKMKEALELGGEYSFKVLLVDPNEHRMALGTVREEKQEIEGDKIVEGISSETT